MANINASFVIEDGLAFDETQTGIFAGGGDPTSGPGEPAPVGSLFVRSTGELYVKTSVADTGWTFVLRTGDVTFDGLAPTTTKGDIIARTTTGNVRVAVGADRYVLTADSTQPSGLVWAPDQTTEIQLDSGEPTGFVNRADSTISFDNGTRTFTIAPAVTSFDVYLKGKKFTKSATETIVVPNTTGTYFIYYDGALCALNISTSPFVLSAIAPVALVYWNTTQGKNVLFAEERHGITMDWSTHEYLHRTRGTQFAGGFDLEPVPNTAGIGDTDDESQIDVNPGEMYDEDIKITVVDSLTPSAQFEQYLSGPAKIPMFYKLGASNGEWYRDTATNFPLKMGSTYPYWNEYTGGAWQLTESTPSGSKFFATWIIATNDVNEPIIGIVGQALYSSLSQAQEAELITQVLSNGLPFQEFRPIWRVIFETKNSYTNTTKATIRDTQDLRATQIVTSVIEASGDHGTLSGLGDDDHAQYVHIDTARTITAQHTFAPISAAAPFILGANAQGQLVTGLNADLLDGFHASAFQPVDADLTSISNITAVGVAVRSAADTWVTRTITGTAGNIIVTNGAGVGGDPTINLATAGTAGTYGSSTAVPVITTDTFGRVTNVTPTNIVFPVQSVFGRTGAITAVEGDYTLNLLGDVTISSPVNGQILQYNGSGWVNSPAPIGSGTVTSVAATGSTGLTVGGSPITSAGTITLTLDTGLQNLASFASTGILVATATDTWAARTITAGSAKIAISNGSGVADNPTIDLGTVVLDDLADADTTTVVPVVGDRLIWNGTNWVPGAGPGSGGGGTRTWAGIIASQSGTTLIPVGASVPTIVQGTQIMSLTLTPPSVNAKYIISLSLSSSASTNNNVHSAVLFRGNTYLGAAIQTFASGGNSNAMTFLISDLPNTASPITYSIRYGTSANTWYINRRSTENTFGGARSGWQVQEY